MNPFTSQAKDILIDSAFEEYERGIKFLYSELVDLNVNIFLIEEILQFPFDLFAGPDDLFFPMVLRNFYDASLLIITRLATDTGNDLFTLLRFKNRVRELVKPEYRNLFQKWLRKERFDKQTKTLLERAELLRDKRVAHLHEDVIAEKIPLTRPKFSELKVLRNNLNSLLGTLSFGTENAMLPLAYDPNASHPEGSEMGTDVERLLDYVARNSFLLNMPERDPTRWHCRRNRLTETKLDQLNHYRRRFNLPEV